MNYVLSLNINQAKKLIDEASVGEERDSLFKYYISIFPNFDKKSFVTFSEYYEKNRSRAYEVTDTRSQEDIIKEVMAIQEKFK